VLVPIDGGEPFTDVALRIGRDAQGRILIGGSNSRATGNNDFCLVRLTADGELDADFGQAGVHTYASQAGGTDLDTLFVDEGFGSLDAETLEDVMDTLDTLRDGGRVVGVVSHVPELQTRIPTQLRVHRGRHGSHTTLSLA
jgi:hypothetical protein